MRTGNEVGAVASFLGHVQRESTSHLRADNFAANPHPSAAMSSSSPRERMTRTYAPKQWCPLQHHCTDSPPKTTMEVDPLRWRDVADEHLGGGNAS
jgi:hypothetical protein